MIGLSELRAQGWKYGCLAALVLSAAGWGFGGVQSYRLQVAKGATALLAAKYAKADKARAEAQTRASEAARAEEQARARAMESAAKAYERGKLDAQATADRVADDLRAGNRRLRSLWQGCAARPASGVSGTAPGASEPDAGAELRAASAGRIVGTVAACQAQVIGLQDVVRADREQHASRPGN